MRDEPFFTVVQDSDIASAASYGANTFTVAIEYIRGGEFEDGETFLATFHFYLWPERLDGEQYLWRLRYNFLVSFCSTRHLSS
jgi:hypothetical protein